MPNGARLERALSRLDFLLSVDLYVNETSRHADVILPPTFGLERDHYDLAFQLTAVRNFAKYSEPVFARQGDQLHDWEIMMELTARIHAPARSLARPIARIARLLSGGLAPRFWIQLGLRTGPYGTSGQGLTLDALRKQASGVDLGPLMPRLPKALFTSDKCIDLVPAAYLKDVQRVQLLLDPGTHSDTLTLIGRRHLRSNNSWLHNSPRLMKGKPRCTLVIHPDDARSRNLEDGEPRAGLLPRRTGACAL